MKVLTQNEIVRLLNQAYDEGYYEMFLLELTTGMRRGEILGLKWRDLNLETGELNIKRQLTTKGISVPKTKSSIRTVLLPPDMLDLLREMKKTAKYDWIFPSPVKEGEPRNPTAITKRFRIMLERAHCKHVRFHDLRHTFATMALENGMDVKTLSAMIGHVSSETTLNIYSHVTDTMRAQAAVKIDREIGGTDAQMPEFEEKEPEVEQIPTRKIRAVQAQTPQKRNRLYHNDKRPPLRRQIHTLPKRKANLQKCLCKNKRRVRAKALRVNKNDESRNRQAQKEKRIKIDGRASARPSKFASEVNKDS